MAEVQELNAWDQWLGPRIPMDVEPVNSMGGAQETYGWGPGNQWLVPM